MTHSSKCVVVVAICLSVRLFCTGASATTVVPPAFEEMAERADLIFVGKVADARAEWRSVGTNRVIFTLVEFDTEEVLKGHAGPAVKLLFLGGTTGGITLVVAGVPRFNVGDRVFLFVEGNGVLFCPLVGVFHGKFTVRKDEKSGRDIVFMHDGRPLRDVAEIGIDESAEVRSKRARLSIPTDREPMSVDDFKRRIRVQLGKKAAP